MTGDLWVDTDPVAALAAVSAAVVRAEMAQHDLDTLIINARVKAGCQIEDIRAATATNGTRPWAKTKIYRRLRKPLVPKNVIRFGRLKCSNPECQVIAQGAMTIGWVIVDQDTALCWRCVTVRKLERGSAAMTQQPRPDMATPTMKERSNDQIRN